MATIHEWLEKLSNGSSSTAEDGRKIQNLMRRLGYPNCVVAVGVVYLEGQGTITNPPTSIQQVARSVLTTLSQAKKSQMKSSNGLNVAAEAGAWN